MLRPVACGDSLRQKPENKHNKRDDKQYVNYFTSYLKTKSEKPKDK